MKTILPWWWRSDVDRQRHYCRSSFFYVCCIAMSRKEMPKCVCASVCSSMQQVGWSSPSFISTSVRCDKYRVAHALHSTATHYGFALFAGWLQVQLSMCVQAYICTLDTVTKWLSEKGKWVCVWHYMQMQCTLWCIVTDANNFCFILIFFFVIKKKLKKNLFIIIFLT